MFETLRRRVGGFLEARIQARIRRRAADWLFRMEFEEITEAQSRQFEDWLFADASHEREYRLQWISTALMKTTVQELSQEALAAPRRPARKSRVRWTTPNRWAAALSATAAIAAVAWGLWIFHPTAIVYATRTGERRSVQLPDGSQVTLNTRTHLRWERCGVERCVRLATGEAFFQVVSDREHPFHVLVSDGSIDVTGTTFDVRQHEGETQVIVESGTVLVRGGGHAAAWSRVLRANERVAFDARGIVTDVSAVSGAAAASWRGGSLTLNDTAAAVVCALAEYIDAPIYYDVQLRQRALAAHLDLTNATHTLITLPIPDIVVEHAEEGYLVRMRKVPQRPGSSLERCP